MDILRCFSDTLYDEYDAWVSGLHPKARMDFIFFAIVSAIDYYDPTRANLENVPLIKHEQGIFYKILQKYLISKLGQTFFDERFPKESLPERLNERILNRAHVIKNLYESTVLTPSLAASSDIWLRGKCVER